jgi:hypothetical protein
MASMTKRIAKTAAIISVLYAARRYFRNWGSTKAECQMRLPGDALVRDPAIQATEAVYVDAPSTAVWSSLMRMGRDRVEGLQDYSGVRDHDADSVRPECHPLDVGDLAVGEVVRIAPPGWLGLAEGVTLTVAEVVSEKYLVFTVAQPNRRWDAVWSLHLQPHWEDRVRLLARARIALRYPGEVFVIELSRPLLALGTRGLLLGIKHRVERMPCLT